MDLPDNNPKTVFGHSKPPLALIPRSALMHEAMAFADGDDKYVMYNWREKAVSIMGYLHAAERHIGQFIDGEDYDVKSKVHHLGHARACLAIVLDSLVFGNAIDNRPLKCPITELIEELTITRQEVLSERVRLRSWQEADTAGDRGVEESNYSNTLDQAFGENVAFTTVERKHDRLSRT